MSATVTESDALSIAWRQTARTPVTLNPINALPPSSTAPAADFGVTLAFDMTAQSGDTTATDSVLVEIWWADQDPNDSTLLGLPVPHKCSLNFMKPLRYRVRHGS